MVDTMKKQVTIAFLYNVRHVYPDPDNPESQLETDFDSPETIEKMIIHFQNCGYKIIPIEANKEAYIELYKQKEHIDLVFNFSEGIYGHDREAQLPAMLEMLQIPYTGSKPLTQALVLNKAKAKDIFKANHIPTLPYQVFATPQDSLAAYLSFPLIVKPLSEGSSAGITNKSVVYSEKELREQLHSIYDLFHKPILVETFVDGREFSVGMLGDPPIILPFIEPNHHQLPKEYEKIDSLEVKWILEEQGSIDNYLICPAHVDDNLRKQIETMCFVIWNVFEINDFCRIDFRCDSLDNPFVLEINSPAGLIPPEISTTSYFPLAARQAGMDYETVLKTIVQSALRRYGRLNTLDA